MLKYILVIISSFVLFVSCDSDDEETIGSVPPTTPQDIADQVAAVVPDLRSRLEALSDSGVDIAYPMVRLTVLEQFSTFLADDIEAGQDTDEYLEEYADELWTIKGQTETEIADLEAGNLNPSVPRFVSSPITIQNGAFWATVVWNDGSGSPQESWPVIFNGYGHGETVIRDIELLPDYGCHIIQMETGPVEILPEEGTISTSRIHELVAILDRAENANVMVNLLLSPNYFPDWAFAKWPDIKKTGKLDEYINFYVDTSNTNARAVIEDFLNALIPEIKDHTALHSITLTNEPSYFNPVGDPGGDGNVYNRTSYNSWLAEEYGSIDAVSGAHGETYSDYDDVPVFYSDDQFNIVPSDGTGAQIADFYRFNDIRFAAFHEWMADTIHQMAPDIPVHVKITDQTWGEPFEGVDPEAFTAFSQIAGNDSAKYYRGYDDDFVEAAEYFNQNILFDLQRSVGDGKPIFNSENHIVEDNETEVIPSVHVRNAIWQAAIHGLGASTVWVWERMVYDEEAEVERRGSIMNRPKNVVEIGRTALDQLRLGKEINAFQTASARTAIIYSKTSILHGEGNSGPLYVLYEAVNSCGEHIEFITESGLARGDAANYELVLAHGVTHLPEASYEGLAANPPSRKLVLIGTDNFKKDHLGRSYSFTTPGNTTTLTGADEAYAIRSELLPILESLPGGRPVSVKDIDADNEDVFGVEWRSVVYNGYRLVNITNYDKSTKRVTIEGLSTANRTDLITGDTIGSTVTIEPLQVYLLSAPGADTTPPKVTITFPTSSSTCSTEATSVTLGGTASDNVGVTSLTWSSDRGGIGEATGITEWRTSAITLYSGDNVITVTAVDEAGNTGEDSITITCAHAHGCPDCSGDQVTLEDLIFAAETDCSCVATVSMTIGSGVIVREGATLTISSQEIHIEAGFHAERGANIRISD